MFCPKYPLTQVLCGVTENGKGTGKRKNKYYFPRSSPHTCSQGCPAQARFSDFQGPIYAVACNSCLHHPTISTRLRKCSSGSLQFLQRAILTSPIEFRCTPRALIAPRYTSITPPPLPLDNQSPHFPGKAVGSKKGQVLWPSTMVLNKPSQKQRTPALQG